jgi:acyl carrier protein
VDWARFTPPFTLRRPSPLISDLPEARHALTAAQAPAAAAGAGTALARDLAALPPAGQDQALVDLVRARTAAVLGHASLDEVPAARPFSDLGIDSLTALELCQHLAAVTGLRLPTTLVFDYPTPRAVARQLRAGLLGETVEGSGVDVNEAVIRRALAAVPLVQFRAAGVMDVLLKLADLHDGAGVPVVGSRADSIDEMDTEGLIRMALGDGGS